MKRFFTLIAGLFGLSLVIMVHELGHFCACKLFSVPVPLFSVGFGPALIAYKIAGTIFQIAFIPVGGYVSIAQKQLELQPYLIKCIILLAGIAANFLFAFLIFVFFQWRNTNIRDMMAQVTNRFGNGVMGPVGIISVMGYSAALSFTHFFLMVASLSIGVGMFNLLPLPFFDGGQIAWYTIELISGPLPSWLSDTSSWLFLVLFLLFIAFISLKDVRQLRR